MSHECSLTCACGATAWTIKNKDKGRHIMCFCADCQTFPRHLGREAKYLTDGGTQIFQTLPTNVEITKGAENVGLLRLSPKGLFRWYATCCNTPMANTLPNDKLPFCGMILPQGDDQCGPVKSYVNTKAAETPMRDKGMLGAVVTLMARGFGARIRGKTQPSPFFDSAGAPRAEATVLTLDQRNAARP
jgi:hypothetical protein